MTIPRHCLMREAVKRTGGGDILLLLEWDFFPRDAHTELDQFLDSAVFSFLSGLIHTGVLLNGPWHLVALDDRVRFFGIAPAEDALETENFNRYVRESLEKVLQQSRQPPSLRVLGNAQGTENCCSCEAPTGYVLITTFLRDEPPVRCADCGRPVPLYRIPRLPDEEEHSDIRQWAGNYQAYDTLYMLSGAGERSSYRQMSRLDSALTREGRQICANMAARTGKPWYYYLHRDYSPQRKVCPGCGGPRALGEQVHGLYDYRCDHCFLLSVAPKAGR
jgi:predicted  nucleic acid-binding Zn ribbon protein